MKTFEIPNKPSVEDIRKLEQGEKAFAHVRHHRFGGIDGKTWALSSRAASDYAKSIVANFADRYISDPFFREDVSLWTVTFKAAR